MGSSEAPCGQRKIVHIDMDCFYAAVEMRNNPALRDKPIAVGGSPSQRGVIATSNYLARRYGVRSAMASSRALTLCPNLVLVAPNFSLYKRESEHIRTIFQRFTSSIEPLSLDEAFLDVSAAQACNGSATLIAAEIRRLIYVETGLTASAGVAPNKLLAKVGSGFKKPNAQTVITPQEVSRFVEQLPVSVIPGVGKVSEKRLLEVGIHTCLELQQYSRLQLVSLFGKWGHQLYEYCRGIDDRPVETHWERKSLSVETTFPSDLEGLHACQKPLQSLFAELQLRLQREPRRPIRSLFAKVKFADFRSTTVERAAFTHLDAPHFETLVVEAMARQSMPVRLLGLGVRFGRDAAQLELWP